MRNLLFVVCLTCVAYSGVACTQDSAASVTSPSGTATGSQINGVAGKKKPPPPPPPAPPPPRPMPVSPI